MRRYLATWREATVVLAGFLALAVVYAWPLVLHIGDAVPRDNGDPLLSVWTLWWNARTLPLTAAWWHGPVFHPVDGTLAFSDHRLGLGVITTPLILAGASPLAAYNVAFLLSFVLSAAAVYGLVRTLTGARLPAVVAGIMFGFHPFRATHLEHLELLSVYWLPAAFWALHVWHARRSAWALVAVAGALTALAFTSGYYFFFGGIAIAAWVVWFERRAAAVDLARLAIALAVPCLLVAPVLWHYQAVHDGFGFQRSISEIEFFSADLRDVLTTPSTLAVWRLPWPVVHAERALFPGVTALCVGAWTWWRLRRRDVAPMTRVRRGLLVVGLLALSAAAVAAFTGGWAFTAGPISLSLRVAYKPMSIAAAALALWALTSPRMGAAWQRQSPLAFYVVATLGLWVLALGPTARAFGERVLYKAPYAWLMVLPGFSDGFRVPARFALVAALTSAVAVALALVRWRAEATPGRYRTAVVIVGAAALIDGWIRPLPLHTPPVPLELPAAVRADDVVLEVPTGIFEDAAAMYRATLHGRRLANGLSGYHPPHYVALTAALQDGDVEALAVLPAADEVVVFVARGPGGQRVREGLARMPWATLVAETSTHQVFRIRREVPAAAAGGASLPVVGVQVSEGDATAAEMLDLDDRTAWQTAGQRGQEVAVLDLGTPVRIGGVDVVHGAFFATYGRELAIDHSVDGQVWAAAWQARVAPWVVADALAHPTSVTVTARFTPAVARFVRVRQVGTSPRPWTIAEVRVVAPPRP